MTAIAYHDNDHVPVLLATSSTDGKTPVLVWADPITHRLLVSASSSATTTVYTETPSGLINGSNTSYTTVNTINNIFGFWINGEYIDSSQFTVSTNTITFGTALPASLSGTAFEIKYQ